MQGLPKDLLIPEVRPEDAGRLPENGSPWPSLPLAPPPSAAAGICSLSASGCCRSPPHFPPVLGKSVPKSPAAPPRETWPPHSYFSNHVLSRARPEAGHLRQLRYQPLMRFQGLHDHPVELLTFACQSIAAVPGTAQAVPIAF